MGSAGNSDAHLDKLPAAVFHGCATSDDDAGIEVDDVAHTLTGDAVGRNLDDRRDGVAGGRAEAGGKEHESGAGTDLRGDALNVVAGRALQVEAGGGGVLGIVNDAADGRQAAFARGASGFDGVRDEAFADVAGGWIEGEAGFRSVGAVGVVLHEVREAPGEFVRGAAID